MYVQVIITSILVNNVKSYEYFGSNLKKISSITIKKTYKK